jgi:hypothetical protein
VALGLERLAVARAHHHNLRLAPRFLNVGLPKATPRRPPGRKSTGFHRRGRPGGVVNMSHWQSVSSGRPLTRSQRVLTKGGTGAVGLKRGCGGGVRASAGGSPRDGAAAGAGATWNPASAWAAAAAAGDGPAVAGG